MMRTSPAGAPALHRFERSPYTTTCKPAALQAQLASPPRPESAPALRAPTHTAVQVTKWTTTAGAIFAPRALSGERAQLHPRTNPPIHPLLFPAGSRDIVRGSSSFSSFPQPGEDVLAEVEMYFRKPTPLREPSPLAGKADVSSPPVARSQDTSQQRFRAPPASSSPLEEGRRAKVNARTVHMRLHSSLRTASECTDERRRQRVSISRGVSWRKDIESVWIIPVNFQQNDWVADLLSVKWDVW